MHRTIRRGLILSVLTTLILLLSAVTAFAEVDAVVSKTIDNNGTAAYYQYIYEDLNKSYVAYRKDKNSVAAKIYSDYIKRTTVAYKDTLKGYIDYQAVSYQYRRLSVMSGIKFELNQYIATLKSNPFPTLTKSIQTNLLFVSLVDNELVFTGTLKEKVLKPSSNKPSGRVAKGESAALSSTPGATIYYTADGSDPKISNSRVRYINPITMTTSITIKAYARKDGMEDSEVETFIYTIEVINAAELQESVNYSIPTPGSAAGTTKITTLRNLPEGASKWQIVVKDSALNVPIMNERAGSFRA